MAGAGRQDREKLNMVAEGQSDEGRAVFCALFWCCHVSGGRDGAAGVSCGLHGKGEKKETCGWGRVCHSSLQGGLIGVGNYLLCT